MEQKLRTPADPRLMRSILKLMRRYGLKALTMDSVAQSLHISKRTLYEIFESKLEMARVVMHHSIEQGMAETRRMVETSDNVILTFMKSYSEHQKILNETSAVFFTDMDEYFPELREMHHAAEEQRIDTMNLFYSRGVEQGLFRRDVNIKIMSRMLGVQFESLKRIENLFHNEFSFEEVCATIMIGFMRSIATPKGMRLFDELCNDPRYGLSKSAAISDQNKKKS